MKVEVLKYEQKMKNSQLIVFVIILSFLVGLGYFQYKYNEIPVELTKQSPYKFNIQIDPWHEFRLYSALIDYDSKTKSGKISFEVDRGIEPDHFVIQVPKELDITNISIKNGSIELKEGIDFLRENESNNLKTEVDLYDFKKSLEDCNVYIEFEGELIPNAEFYIDFIVERASPVYKLEFFYFNIGDYYCSSPDNCFSSDWDSFNKYDYRWKSGSENVLTVAKIDGKSLQKERFYLIVEQNRSMLEKKQNYNQYRFLFFGSLIGFIIGVITQKLSSKKFD